MVSECFPKAQLAEEFQPRLGSLGSTLVAQRDGSERGQGWAAAKVFRWVLT